MMTGAIPGDRRFEGADEPILEPDLEIVDAHLHLFDRPGMRYLADDYRWSVTSGHHVVASVYVETLAFARQSGPELMRPLGEIAFADAVAEKSATAGACRIAAAIVAHARLSAGDAIADYLDRAQALAPARLRGVRETALDHERDAAFRYIAQRPPRGLLQSTGFRSGFAHLAPRGLSFDAAVFDPQLDDVGALAGAFPDTRIILNHLGFAMAIDLDPAGRHAVFLRWRDALRRLAAHENVFCKIGGLGLPPWGFGFETRGGPTGSAELAEAWRPYVETAIECFGVDRAMMESDYPPDARSCGFVPLFNALKIITGGCSDAEKSALYRDTALTAYRLTLPPTEPAVSL